MIVGFIPGKAVLFTPVSQIIFGISGFQPGNGQLLCRSNRIRVAKVAGAVVVAEHIPEIDTVFGVIEFRVVGQIGIHNILQSHLGHRNAGEIRVTVDKGRTGVINAVFLPGLLTQLAEGQLMGVIFCPATTAMFFVCPLVILYFVPTTR